MQITIHAGHNPDGHPGCGASDYLLESTEARRITKKIIPLLTAKGVKVKDITVNDGKSQVDVLDKLVSKANKTPANLHVSIHFNASKHAKNDGKTTGVEAYVYNKSGIAYKSSLAMTQNIAKLGFKNRGVKYGKHLKFLRKTKAPALLIEVCFVTDQDDAILYKQCRGKIANAIANAILQAVG